MDNLNIENLKIVLTKSGNSIKLDWKGKSDAQNSNKILDDYFESIKDKIDIDKELILRFTDLEYFTSSSIASLVKLLQIMDKKCVKVSVLYNKDKLWQRMTFKSLETYAQILKHVDITAE